MKTIGNKIKELRRSKGMSQKDIADKLGVTSQAVSKWENDGSLPEMTMLPDIASLFGIQIDDLFEYSTEKRYESIEKKLQYGRVMTNMEFENEEAFLIREVEADPTNYHAISLLGDFYGHRAECMYQKSVYYAKRAIDLKWNPHIHALISEGGAGNITPWRPVKHFDYNFLRNAFRKVLLERLTSRIGPAFRKVKNEMYTKHADGFYVRAKPNLCTPDITIKYISRYLGRPVIATSRIDTYDGENVTFHYTRHEDNKTVTETIPALNFIQKLIVHIPEKHFKMLRYYGIYAKHHKQEKKLRKCISAEKQRFLRSIQDWRQSILLSFGYDPLCCSECGTSMLVLEVYHKKTALFEQYRKVMKYG
jgi:transcriptional regulator with XRE-family HTH domain